MISLQHVSKRYRIRNGWHTVFDDVNLQVRMGEKLGILGRKLRSAGRRSQEIMGEIYHRFQESLQGMLVVKAFNYERGAISKFRDENDSLFHQMMRYFRATALSGRSNRLGNNNGWRLRRLS